MKQDIEQKIERLKEEDLCRHCFGRQFAKIGHGLENYERTWIIQNKDVTDRQDIESAEVDEELSPGGECHLCKGTFNNLEAHAKTIKESVQRYNPSTFLIGIRPETEAKQKEEQLWEEHPPTDAETMKTELSRLLGKMLERKTGMEVDFKRPDVNPVLDLNHQRVEVKVNSVLIYGTYNKYSREIPQTTWHCRKCRGDGCQECDWTGKNYETSVQELVQEPFIQKSKAIEAKFHGGGREDVDAKCFGQREFVLELIEPLERDLDLEEARKQVNKSSDVEIFDIRKCKKDKIQEIKQKDADKTYRAEITVNQEVGDKDISNIENLENTMLSQETPKRVKHRRADLVRERKVKKVKAEKTGPNKIEAEIEAEAGTYIKEFVSSDEERTRPSIAGEIGKKAQVTQLDVIDIQK